MSDDDRKMSRRELEELKELESQPAEIEEKESKWVFSFSIFVLFNFVLSIFVLSNSFLLFRSIKRSILLVDQQ